MDENKSIDEADETKENDVPHKKYTLAIVVGSLLVFFTIGSIIFFVFFYTSDEIITNDQDDDYIAEESDVIMPPEVPEVSEDDLTNTVEIEDGIFESQENLIETTDFDADTNSISKGSIMWQEPEDVGDLGYFNPSDTDCTEKSQYYKTGSVVSGNYEGYDIYFAQGGDCDMFPMTFRILVKDNKAIFFEGHRRFEDWELDRLTNGIGGESENKIIDGNIVIEELIYPDSLNGNGAIVHDRKYLDGFFYEESYGILKKAFDSEYGTVWMTDRAKADELYANKEDKTEHEREVYAAFSTNAFYLKAPDSTIVQYVLQFDFLPEGEKDTRIYKLPIVWSDGTTNEKEYELFPMGCGITSFAYDMTQEVNVEKDLQVIGKMSNGDNIYGYKSTQHPEFKKWYKDIYWGKDGAKKPEGTILKEHPQIFWVDSFGRTLAFYAMDFISPAECGKPVIYLYPQETIDVHVRVTPNQGFTITEPPYGDNGWFVQANNNGVITNYADSKEYPYLFWEGHSDELYTPSQKGFIATNTELGELFDTTLSQLGLNTQEISDFKEFWVPKMQAENRPYYFVSFMSQSFINKSAPLDIDPKPDTVIRVLMNYQGLDKYKQVEEQKLYAPAREGFTVVEWGGVLH